MSPRWFHFTLAIFLVLSVGDFLLTWKLIAAEDSEIAEINPIALTLLQRFGWGGLAVYKVALVAGIVGVIVTIHSRRPHAGEAVMTFGCGAQATIVITSLLLLRNMPASLSVEPDPDRWARYPKDLPWLPNGAMAILPNKAVQDELRLDDAMVERIAICHQERIELRQKLHDDNVSENIVRLTEQVAHERTLAAMMTAGQTKRLYELTLQARGALALLDADVTDTLQLSDEQVDAIRAIVKESPADVNTIDRRRSARQDSSDVDVFVNSRIADVLSPTQRHAWQNMLGIPFQFNSSIASEPERHVQQPQVE
jgi:hypothetical protein